MSEKIVKITNGKILNYKISASGYKTIYGSKLISADTSITHNMIAENDPNDVYSLGDRIGGIATFVCYFNSTNPETNVDTKYAVFVLDAAYRTNSVLFGGDANADGLLPAYNTNVVLSAKESATYNTDVFINNFTSTQAIAMYTGRNAAIITLGNNQYKSQIPNCYELSQIYANKATLDTYDTTLSDNSGKGLESWSNTWASNIISYGNPYFVNTDGEAYSTSRGSSFRVVPVFEIPVE